MDQIQKAETLRSLHVPGDPLILINVWDSTSARTAARVDGVRALGTASEAISEMHGMRDGGSLTLDQALLWADIVSRDVDLPVSVDFEKGYAIEPDDVGSNVERLIANTSAAGINLEDSFGADESMMPLSLAAERVAAARSAADRAGVPIVISARVDRLAIPDAADASGWDDMLARANAYLAAGADAAFVRRLATEDMVRRAVADIQGPVSVLSNAASVPLQRLVELGVARVSFGASVLGCALAEVGRAAAELAARRAYPAGLSFRV